MPEPAQVSALRPRARGGDWIRATWPAVVAVIAALLVRYLAVEPEAIAHACQPEPWSGACAARTAVIQLFLGQRIGWAALAVALVALALRRRPIAVVALALAGPALVLYSFEPAAVALVVAVLVLARR